MDVDDWTNVEVEMKNGGWGSIEASRISADLEEETRFEIYGTKGSIKYLQNILVMLYYIKSKRMSK